MRLKYICEFCGFNEIQHYRRQPIGEPVINRSRSTVNYSCPNCGPTQWNINQFFTYGERVYLFFYQKFLNILAKIGLKNYLVEKGITSDELLEEYTGER